MSSVLKEKVVQWTSGSPLSTSELTELFELVNTRADDELVAEALENCKVSIGSLHQLQTYLSSSDGDQAYWAATFLGRLGRAANEAQHGLCALANDDGQSMAARQRAVWALQQIGPLVPEIRQKLRRLESTPDPRMKRLIEALLNQAV
jgi:hypothetical protein